MSLKLYNRLCTCICLFIFHSDFQLNYKKKTKTIQTVSQKSCTLKTIRTSFNAPRLL